MGKKVEEKATVGLYMIVKDEYEKVLNLLADVNSVFDELVITVSDKSTYEKLSKFLKKHLSPKDGKLIIDYRPWNDRFDDARNHNWTQGSTDYGFWVDADDEFDFRTIPLLLNKAVEENIDVIWLPYHYAHDESGNVIAVHWRERLVNRHKGFAWRGWVHENLLSEESYTSERVDLPVIHRSQHVEASQERNVKILEKAYEETNDPRYIHYLGIAYYGMERFEDAIRVLSEYIKVGGWDEEIYRSLLRMADASNLLGKKDNAVQYSLQAAALLPEYPDAYFSLAQFEFSDNKFKETLEWLKVAFKKQRPETSSINDPTVPDKARFIGAISEFNLGNHRDALEMLKGVKTMPIDDLLPEFEHEASVDRLAAILPALLKHYEKPEQLWESLDPSLKYDNRFRKLRERVTEPKTWAKKSIVFFCGRGFEEWGPHTLGKGMGGSEEAIVYLSRELAKLGYDVTVYGEVEKPLEDAGVKWLPWNHIDRRDKFDTLVIWRYPQFVNQFKANKILVDVHDLIPQKVVKPYEGVTYLFKSQFHKDRYPTITNYKVIPNGLLMEQFSGNN